MVTIVKTFIMEKTPPPFTMFATVAPGARRPKSKMTGRSVSGTRWMVTHRMQASARLDALGLQGGNASLQVLEDLVAVQLAI